MKLLKISMPALAIAALAIGATAAEPSGYYSKAYGKNKGALLSALQSIVGNPNTVSYNGLWSAYKDTDTDANGKIIDMYSNYKFTYGSDQCGSYSAVGDCYNREHSMPQSWWSSNTMKCDLFHVYPTDGKVNGQRSNYPFGECANGERLTSQGGKYYGKGKLGDSTYPGYTGLVWEPDDEYKGDFARSYFYVAAAYNSEIKNWETSKTNLGGTSYPAFNAWTVTMLMEWHRLDPVSEKETKRNEAVYKKQHNRNPFIDHPELAEYIWGDKKDSQWNGSAELDPRLTSPVDGATIDLGGTTAGTSLSTHVNVKGSDLSKDLTIAITGDADFKAGVSTITAAQAMAGYDLTVSILSDVVGSHTATLSISSDEARAFVTLKAEVQEPSTDPAISLGIASAPLKFNALVGEASTILEVPVYTENITKPVSVKLTADGVDAIEMSLDRSNWTDRLSIDPDGETIYLRGKAMDAAGRYVSLLELEGEGSDDRVTSMEVDVIYTVTEERPEPEVVTETWEGCATGGYWNEQVQGAKFRWDFNDAGLWADDSRHGAVTCRFGKQTTSSIAMAEDYAKGCSAVSFFAAVYRSDAAAKLTVDYSLNGGSSWTALQSFDISSSSLTECAVDNLDLKGNVRLRIRQEAGSRVNIDDITIVENTDDSAVPVVNAAAEWQAVPTRGGVLVTAPQGSHVVTYTLDARVVADTIVASKPQLVPLAPGIYIVTLSNSQGRKVVVK